MYKKIDGKILVKIALFPNLWKTLTVWIESQMVNEQFSAGEMSVAEQRVNNVFQGLLSVKKIFQETAV